MPTVTAPAKVLVSGATGFIAIWVVKMLLDHGYAVRGTIRSESKGTNLRHFFKDEVASGKLELIIVPEMMAPGAFDEAVKGVDVIEHTASPVGLNADDPNEQIEPAVKGTLGILESALNHAGPQLKRVVFTSSCAAVSSQSSKGTLDESSWNDECVAEVREKGRNASQLSKYRASKSLAERAAWDFVTKHSSTITWDFVTLCPPYVFGPVIHEVSTPNTLNASISQIYNALFKKENVLQSVEFSWVDVRDVAQAHVRALEVPEAGGQRFIIASGPWIWQDWVDTANSLKPEIPGLYVSPGTPGAGKDFPFKVQFDNTKVCTVLGLEFCDKSTTMKDMINDFKARGWEISAAA